VTGSNHFEVVGIISVVKGVLDCGVSRSGRLCPTKVAREVLLEVVGNIVEASSILGEFEETDFSRTLF
jgi:hypothetical protein